MSYAEIAFLLLGISVLVHIAFVTADLGSGLLVATARTFYYRKGEQKWEDAAKKLFRLMIISELFSGVWGTIITVFLAAFFGGIVALATSALFIPIAVSIASIMIRIPSIAASWYLWNRIDPKIHTVLMWIMALSGFGVPIGFRTIFAEINYPYAIASYLTGNSSGGAVAFLNPIYWYLMLHTVLASISVGGYILASLSALENDALLSKVGIKVGLSFALAQSLAGGIYYISLGSYSPLLQSSVNSSTLPLFTAKLLLVGFLLYFSIEGLYSSNVGKAVLWLAPLSLTIVVLGEALNDGSRYPYFVLMGNQGISINSFFDYLIPFPEGTVITVLSFLIIASAVFSVALYYGLLKRYVTEPR